MQDGRSKTQSRIKLEIRKGMTEKQAKDYAIEQRNAVARKQRRDGK